MQRYLNCNVCGSEKHKIIFPDFHVAKNGTVGIAKCLECGLIFRNVVNDSFENIQGYKEKAYPKLSNSWIVGRKKIFLKYLHDLEKYRKTNKILDIGAGHGFFLSSCKDRNWECYGIEPSHQCHEYAKKYFNLDLIVSTLDETHFEENCFDIVTFWNVLDQLENPKEIILRANKLLRPGGLVLIRCPNWSFHGLVKIISTLLSSVHPVFFELNKTVFHLYSFNAGSMTNLLKHANFGKITISPTHLSWTTTHNSTIQIKKMVVLNLLKIITDFLYVVSNKRHLFSPSFCATAIKVDTNSS